MSDVAVAAVETPAPVAAPEPSAPVAAAPSAGPSQSSRDIVAAAVHAAEAPKVETPAPVVPATEPELSRAAKFLVSQGHKIGKREDGRTDLSYLPASTVEKFLDKYADEHRAEWNGARGEIEGRVKTAESNLNGFLSDVRGDPKAFLAKIATVDPRYRAFLEPAAPAPVAAPLLEMPGPNVTLPDGSTTYDVAGIQKLIEWAVDAKMMPKVDERLKPWQDRDKEAQAASDAEKAQTAVRDRARSQMETAKSWPNWADWEGDVLKMLQDDSATAAAAGQRPTMTIKEAYLEVKASKLVTDSTKMREQVIAELNGAQRSTSVTRSGAEQIRPAGPRSTRDVVAEAVRRAEAQSA